VTTRITYHTNLATINSKRAKNLEKKLRSGLNQFPGSQKSLDSFSPGLKIVFQTDLQVFGDNKNHLSHQFSYHK